MVHDQVKNQLLHPKAKTRKGGAIDLPASAVCVSDSSYGEWNGTYDTAGNNFTWTATFDKAGESKAGYQSSKKIRPCWQSHLSF